MASTNRHWPSLFKSKPCNGRHQGHHDMNSSSLLSPSCHRTPYISGCEERNPEPKPRWNPKPEQIRILESIFNSGMVNPPRDEIRRIRSQLQEFGQVGDANVFYWFQNRKSRSKQKQRHHKNPKPTSEKSTPIEKTPKPEKKTVDLVNPGDLPLEPFFSAMVDLPLLCNELFSELTSQEGLKAGGSTVTTAALVGNINSSSTVGGHVEDIIQAACTAARLTVFINDVAFEVGPGLLNVRAAFGEGAVLLHSSGVPVPVDERGFSLLPLQHGASYYLI